MSVNAERRLRSAALVAVAVFTLTACASGSNTAQEPGPSAGASTPSMELPSATSAGPTSAPTPAPDMTAEPAQPVSGADMAAHIHNLAFDGRRLLIGTHDGLWGQVPSATPEPLSRDAFDVMGFTRTDGRWLASGHPGEGMDAPSDLGLLQSTDDGSTWTQVSLGGEVDFHRLVTSGVVVLGVNAHDGRLLRSDDDGVTWTDLGTPGLYDLAVDPSNPAIVVGTTENGPVRSTDAGVTFEPIQGVPLLALLAWTGGTLYAADVDGRLHESTDAGATWSARGSLPGQPTALAADEATVAALVDDAILESVDGGATFAPRITDLGGH